MFNLIQSVFARTTGQWTSHDEFHLDKSLNQSKIKLLEKNNWKQINEKTFKYQNNETIINPINICGELKLRPINKMTSHYPNSKSHLLNRLVHLI